MFFFVFLMVSPGISLNVYNGHYPHPPIALLANIGWANVQDVLVDETIIYIPKTLTVMFRSRLLAIPLNGSLSC